MLKQRIWTAVCLIPLVLLILFLGPAWLYQSVLTLIFLAAAYEWSLLAKLSTWYWTVLWWLSLVLVGFAVTFVPNNIVLWLALAGWLIASFSVVYFPRGGHWFRRYTWFRLGIGLWLLIPAWAGLWVLRALPHGAAWVLLLLLLVWGADIGGYFGGRFFGKHLLAREVSPKKTIEGVMGGLILALIACGVVAAFIAPQLLYRPAFWLLILACILLSVLGDLTESMYKRMQSVKDSGQLLPGHGGLLDRIDSLLAATPLFVVGLSLLQP